MQQTLTPRLGLQVSLGFEASTLQKFWHHVSQLGDRVNHSNDNRLIAIDLMDYRAQCEVNGIKPLSLSDLREALPFCKGPKLIDRNRIVTSRHNGKSIFCWVFEK